MIIYLLVIMIKININGIDYDPSYTPCFSFIMCSDYRFIINETYGFICIMEWNQKGMELPDGFHLSQVIIRIDEAKGQNILLGWI